MFESMVLTDEFSASFICCKPKRPPANLNSKVPLEDSTLDKVKNDYKSYYLDPSRTRAFTTASDFENEKLEVYRCSTAEYYTLTGSISYLKN
jgi:hypothetical protein